MSPQLVAGVDSSTQSTKVLVCDAETGAVIRQGRAAHPDGTSVDPQRWWDAWQQATSNCLLEGVEALAVGGQQHGMVALDGDGAVLHEALLWNDIRSAPEASDLMDEFGGAAAWVAAVGIIPVAAITVTKLRWLARHEPSIAAKLTDVVLPHDWLTGRILAGGAARPQQWTTDRGDASGTGYFCAATDAYREDLLELGLGRVCGVPHVLSPSQRAGRTPEGVLVGPGTGDNMAAALGLGLGPGDVVVSLGTSGTVFARTEQPLPDVRGAMQGFADATGRHLPLMCTLNAARVLVAVAELLRVDLAELDRLALAAEPGASGLTLVPYLDGERTPDLPYATGTLAGLTRGNATAQNLARAAVEGMLCNLADGIDRLRELGAPIHRVLLVGGAAKSTAVRQIAPLVFGVDITVPASAEYVALGAARQAAWMLSGADQPPAWTVQTAVDLPSPGPQVGEQLREDYRKLRLSRHPESEA